MSELIAMSQFKTNLKTLMLTKSVEIGEPLNRAAVARATGLSLPTISRWYEGSLDNIEKATVDKLLAYFGCEFGDLVEYIHDDESADQTSA